MKVPAPDAIRKDGEIYFLDRHRQRLSDKPTPRETTLAWMYREFERFDVSAETCVSKYHTGERMDYKHAVMVIMQ